MSLLWTYRRWASRAPSLGTDEMHRHTLVLPVPFVTTDRDPDGTTYHPALVVVIAPRWARWHREARADRALARWERALHRDLRALGDGATDDEFEAVLDRWEPLRPPPR